MQVTTETMVLFWQTDSVFSNWHPTGVFEYDGQSFENSEAAFMYAKAKTFGDEQIAAQILENQEPRAAKKLGRKVTGFDDVVWDQVKLKLMIDVCMAKFSQNNRMVQILMDTSPKELVEGSPYDKIWGIGLAANDPRSLDRKNWKGENLLGQALMKVREWFLSTR